MTAGLNPTALFFIPDSCSHFRALIISSTTDTKENPGHDGGLKQNMSLHDNIHQDCGVYVTCTARIKA